MERIAIAVDNNRVSEHFGRCPSFMIVELNKKEVVSKEKIPNPGHRNNLWRNGEKSTRPFLR